MDSPFNNPAGDKPDVPGEGEHETPAIELGSDIFSLEPGETVPEEGGGSPVPGPDGARETQAYALGEEIGRGGMGRVIKAVDSRLDRTVAMKLMRSVGTSRGRIRFEREARILARLEHPNIVPVHEAGRNDQGEPFYTMKLVRGRTLQSILDGILEEDADCIRRHPLRVLLGVFRKVCDAIEFAHHVGVVHRDLKPENVMVGEFGEVLVMDWGLAKILDASPVEAVDQEANEGPGVTEDPAPEEGGTSGRVTLDGQILGTPAYMAPEQAEGDHRSIGLATDIHALGGILQAILTLRPPLSGQSLETLIVRIRSGQHDPIPQEPVDRLRHCPGRRVPQPLAAVCKRAMALRPEDRYPNIAQLSKDIAAYLEGFATSVEAPSPWQRLHLFAKRHQAGTVAVLLGIVAIAYTFFFSLLYLRKEQRRLGGQVQALQAADSEFRALRLRMIQAETDLPVVAARSDEWRDLVPGLWRQREDENTARWLLVGERIGSPPTGLNHLLLPMVDTSQAYAVRWQVRKLYDSSPLVILLPLADRHAVLILEGKRDGGRVSWIDLKLPAGQTNPTLRRRRLFTEMQSHEMVTLVERPAEGRIRIEVRLDGHPVMDWSGAITELAHNAYWQPKPADGRIQVGTRGGNWLLEAIDWKAGGRP